VECGRARAKFKTAAFGGAIAGAIGEAFCGNTTSAQPIPSCEAGSIRCTHSHLPHRVETGGKSELSLSFTCRTQSSVSTS
jgi:hypothetical protein